MKNKRSQSGFTLIELIAVMVILGILAAVIVPRITTLTSGAYESNVRNMYGLIKNEVTADATKAAMSGNFLETYQIYDNANENHYLQKWVTDYDPSAWSQFRAAGNYVNTGSGGAGTNDALLFMYHPHGRPSGAITWTGAAGGTEVTPAGGVESDNKEDLYWIYYAPRTSLRGVDVGRTNDGFVMAAWKSTGTNDWEFSGSIDEDGLCVAGGSDEECLEDLTFILNPAADS